MSATALCKKNLSVVHPLDDEPEVKLYRADLGRMRMTRPVRLSLFLLQGYLACMLMLLAWRVIAAL
ncbi:MAG: hypothetical protein P4L71_22235 [Acetobacteraceae bacterium]|nr:hypothetical protein [Acetobacteraceae bacterium]